MPIDLDHLRREYSEMTDEALLEIERDQLVGEAQQCLDEELTLRGKGTPHRYASVPDGEEPEWLGEAMTAMSTVGGDVSVADARRVLDRAGIASFIVDREPEKDGDQVVSSLVVPPGQHLLALSVLDRDFFNPITEAEWKTHFEALNDQELLDIDADLLVAGMRDRIERLVRAYEDELLKRGLAELETSGD